jgi:hypothetical protein
MTDYKELMLKELRDARDKYVALRAQFGELTVEKAKIAERIKLIKKLLALEEPKRMAG